MIEINNLTDLPVDKKFFTGVAKKVLTGENKEIVNLSIAFVGPEEIKKLNKKFRDKDQPTDVLSFGYGEVVICPEIAGRGKKELAKVLIHGILHVLGCDHEKTEKEAKAMEEKQEKYLSSIK